MQRSSDPKSVRVGLSAGTGVAIEWQDGHLSDYTFRFLRDACPCAECSELRRRENRYPGQPQPLTLQQMLPAILPLPKATKVAPIGKYGIRLSWSDGHDEGMYSWEFLRDVCPCSMCTDESSHRAVPA